MLIFILKLDEPFRIKEIFIISLFSKVHIFADPDPGSQNLADPMDPDPDPKYCLNPFLNPEI